MHTTSDKPAFRCSVAAELSAATLQIGWSRYPIRVTEVSRDGYTLLVSSAISRKLSQGAKAKIQHAGEAWTVSVEARNQSEAGDIVLRVKREEDLTRLVHRGETFMSLFVHNIGLRNADPVLTIGAICGIALIVLMTPGLGDELGTSSFITECISNGIRGFCGIFSS